MEGLLEKIKNHTLNGPPSVSELIELQELARTLKVPGATLEKMISEAISSKEKEDDGSTINDSQIIEPTYERPDFDSARNSFDAEMNQRRESESIPERKNIEFDRPEIVFPEMVDPFADKKEVRPESESVIEPISEFPKEQGDSIDDISKRIQEIDENTAALEKASQEKMEQVQELMKKKREEASIESQRAIEEAEKESKLEIEKQKTQFAEEEKLREQERIRKENEASQQIELPEEMFENANAPKEGLVDLIETIKEAKAGDIKFEQAVDEMQTSDQSAEEENKYIQSDPKPFEPESFEEVGSKEGIDAWVEKSNEEALKRVEKLTGVKPNPAPVKEQKKERSFARDNSTTVSSKAVSITKSSFAMGVVALVVSVLFGFFGAIVGFFGLKKANEGLKEIKVSPNLYEAGALSKLKNARTMSIIGIVIGVFKFLRMTYWGFYFF